MLTKYDGHMEACDSDIWQFSQWHGKSLCDMSKEELINVAHSMYQMNEAERISNQRERDRLFDLMKPIPPAPNPQSLWPALLLLLLLLLGILIGTALR